MQKRRDIAKTNLKQIVELIASRLQDRSDARCKSFKLANDEASFRFVWAFENSIVFRIQQKAEHKLLIRLEDNEIAKTGTAVMLDKLLRNFGIFTRISWFTQEEIEQDIQGGSPHPY